MKVMGYLMVALLAGSCVLPMGASAEEAKDSARTRLREVQLKQQAAENNYNGSLQKLRATYDEKLNELKKDFHAKRDKVLTEKTEREKKLLADYKDEIAPLKEKEKELSALTGPTSNFAK